MPGRVRKIAKGRLIHKKICVSYQVNRLKNDTARLLFTWLITHLDVEGRFYGDPNIVKSVVFPLKKRGLSAHKVDQYLDDMMHSGLIYRYIQNGVPYLVCPKFDLHQSLRKDREMPSKIPAPDAKKMLEWASKNNLNDVMSCLQDKIREDKDKINKENSKHYQSTSPLCTDCGYPLKFCKCK